jgi:hypothetical protein
MYIVKGKAASFEHFLIKDFPALVWDRGRRLALLFLDLQPLMFITNSGNSIS